MDRLSQTKLPDHGWQQHFEIVQELGARDDLDEIGDPPEELSSLVPGSLGFDIHRQARVEV